jgi:hypothetical protein
VARRHAWRIALASGLIVLLAGVAAYFLVDRSRPHRLTLADSFPRTGLSSPVAADPLAAVCRQPAIPANPTSGASGLWVIQRGSEVGYRAHENFEELQLPHEAVARTDHVRGWLLVGSGASGSSAIETGCVAVDLESLKSIDELPGIRTSDRDSLIPGFLHTSEHPYAVFQPFPQEMGVGAATAPRAQIKVTGALELNGISKTATFDLEVRLASGQLAAAGATTVVVDDFAIEVPQAGNGFVSVDPHITLEIALALSKP